MSDKHSPPVLTELIEAGDPELLNGQPEAFSQPDLSAEDDSFPLRDPATGELPPLDDRSNIQELIIDEEIRMILDKHMQDAYEEIIQLISHRIR